MTNLVTKRQYLVSLGLTRPDSRGRFSAEAQAALYKAEAEGMKFADGNAAPSTTTTPVDDSKPYNAKAVRRWAARNGIVLGARGRIPADIVNRFHAENTEERDAVSSDPVDMEFAPVIAPAPVEPKVPVRDETEAFGFARRQEGDPDYITEPVVGLSNCGRCGEAVQFCNCTSGPWVPSYLTHTEEPVEQALLEKPA
jgi:hypothetical protein